MKHDINTAFLVEEINRITRNVDFRRSSKSMRAESSRVITDLTLARDSIAQYGVRNPIANECLASADAGIDRLRAIVNAGNGTLRTTITDYLDDTQDSVRTILGMTI